MILLPILLSLGYLLYLKNQYFKEPDNYDKWCKTTVDLEIVK